MRRRLRFNVPQIGVEALEPRRLFSGAALNKNLVINGDAEADTGAADASTAVFPSGWTRNVPEGTVFAVNTGFSAVQYGASGGLPDLNTPGPANRGNNFFAGGPDNTADSIYQIIDVSNLSAGIDKGLINVQLSGWLGGWQAEGDHMELSMFFLSNDPSDDGQQYFAGTVTPGDRGNVTKFLQHTVNTTVPRGTRRIAVELDATRQNGVYDDAYADNISLVLSTTAKTGFVGGEVWNDVNGNGKADMDLLEGPLKGVTVFIDKNNNGKLDTGELKAKTNAQGLYTISSVPVGKATVRVLDPPGFRDTGTDPFHLKNPQKVNVQPAQTAGATFNVSQSEIIGGRVLSENLPANGKIDRNDTPLSGVAMYLDINNNGKHDSPEPTVKTNSRGYYWFTIPFEDGRFILQLPTKLFLVNITAMVVRAIPPKIPVQVNGKTVQTPYTQLLPKQTPVITFKKGGAFLTDDFLLLQPKQ